MQLQLETINICNAACVFCPYPKMERPKGIMSDALFHKIITEAAGIEKFDEVSFQGLGEPLLDPQIASRIAFAKQAKRGWVTTMFTNGSRLTPDIFKKLENAGLDILYVSINAVTPEGRKSVMRLDDYDRVVAYVQHAMKSEKVKVVPKGVVNMDLFSGSETKTFQDMWGERSFLHLEGNWGGATYQQRRVRTGICSRMMSQIMVLWDGRVSLCCFDGEGEVIFGDLNTQSIKDVYAGDKYLNYRLAHVEGRRSELKLCATCTEI